MMTTTTTMTTSLNSTTTTASMASATTISVTVSSFVDSVATSSIASAVLLLASWCIFEWTQLHSRRAARRDWKNMLFVVLASLILIHSAIRIITVLDKYSDVQGKEHIALDVIRSFLGMIIHPFIVLLLYNRMLVIVPYPRPAEPVALSYRILHLILWCAVGLTVVAAVPVGIAREVIEIQYYGSEDTVFDAVRVKISSAYQAFAVITGATCTIVFFVKLWSATVGDFALPTSGEDLEDHTERREAIRYFINKNVILAGLIVILCFFYSVVNAITSIKYSSITMLLPLVSVLSLRFLLDVLRELKMGVHKGRHTPRYRKQSSKSHLRRVGEMQPETFPHCDSESRSNEEPIMNPNAAALKVDTAFSGSQLSTFNKPVGPPATSHGAGVLYTITNVPLTASMVGRSTASSTVAEFDDLDGAVALDIFRKN